MRRLSPERYCDEPYGPGTHVVLLVLKDDPLSAPATRAFKRVSDLTGSVTFWYAEIVTTAHAEAVQAIRYPQYRFIRDGSERYQHTGGLDDDGLVDVFDHLED